MQIEECSKPILICGNFRGIAQPIRYIFYFINVQFEEINIDPQGNVLTLGKTLPSNIEINEERLPLLLHENLKIYQLFPIMSYICKRFNHQHLLGRTIHQRARVNQMLQRYLKAKSKKFQILLACFKKAAQSPQKKQQTKIKGLKCLFKKCDYLKPMIQYQQLSKRFVLRDITILDFIFFESCFYIVNMFSDVLLAHGRFLSFFQYKNFIQKQEWYMKNKQKLESFKIIFCELDKNRNEAIQSLWLGDPKFLS